MMLEKDRQDALKLCAILNDESISRSVRTIKWVQLNAMPIIAGSARTCNEGIMVSNDRFPNGHAAEETVKEALVPSLAGFSVTCARGRSFHRTN